MTMMERAPRQVAVKVSPKGRQRAWLRCQLVSVMVDAV